MRQEDGKKKTVISLKNLNYSVTAFGDSYNDINMLKEADTGILFNPPDNVRKEYPELKATYNYKDLKDILIKKLSGQENQ